ncbi:hypothetical protein E0L36_15470 [Streptomyces sp. AJS327]|uniref:hypothetical protein n=1 Tax=Streptomyces sp. AJS327 TaxID=2545265 RepID=UPI0015DEA7EC|nr:hypothetical protein [Streptomyces sp. AJS327]MBA0052253.1 hypothetical protein [Streptomyces sp. AJS327]
MDFTIEFDGASGAHSGLWPEGDCFMVLPEGEHRSEMATAHIRLERPGSFLDPGSSPTLNGSPVTGAPPGGSAGTRRASGPTTVAEVEERTRAHARTHEGHPVLALHDPASRDAPGGSERPVLCRVHPERLPKGEPRHFTVVDERDEPLCRFHRGRSPRSGRATWMIEFPDGSPPVTGYKGTWPGWLAFLLLLPLWVLFFLVSLVIMLVTFGGGGIGLNVWGCPQRKVWRPRGRPFARPGLVYRYARNSYRWNADRLDRRIALAQAAVHHLSQLRA